jgi:hypothetical protein
VISPLVSIKINASYNSSKGAKIPVPKVHINGKINTRMEKTIKNQCLVSLMW